MLTLDQVLMKSAENIEGLHEVVAEATKVLIENCYNKGILIRIVQGLRTIAHQNDLYAQGRTQAELNRVGLSHVKAKPSMKKVTDAKGGTSFHNFGMANDFCLLLPDGKNVTWDMDTDYNSNNIRDWIEVVDEAKKLGFKWGGDWASFKDYPHFDMTFGLSTADYRNGKKPTQKQIDNAYVIINKYKKVGEIPMTNAEKKAFDELVATVARLAESKDVLNNCVEEQAKLIDQQAEQLKKLESINKTVVPDYAKEAIAALTNIKDKNNNPIINTPNDRSKDFYDVITVFYRAGLFK